MSAAILPIATDNLFEASWNARKTFDRSSLDELIASIEEHGIQVPLLVREDRDREGYEVICGHRRLKAASLSGLKTVPCIVRTLSDDQAREIGLVDNLQREDVPALEEADAYAELQQRLGTAAAIAQRVGKEAAYVTRRLALISLGELPRKALAERLITVDHALLLAKLGTDEQLVNLKWCLSPNAGVKEKLEDVIAGRMKDRDAKSRWTPWEPESVAELKHHIEEHVGRKLSRAPWDLEDAYLIPAAGACSSCPSNTKANDLLFGDMSISAATCEDGACFERKRGVFVQLRIDKCAPEQTDGKVLRLSWKATTVKPRAAKSDIFDADGFNSTQVFRKGQWLEAKKGSCDSVRQGVTVDWSDAGDRGYMGGGEKLRKPGQILTVCIAEKCKVHKKAYADAEKREASGSRNENSAEAKAEREKREAAANAENAIRTAQISAALDKLQKLPGEALRLLCLQLLKDWQTEGDANDHFPGLEKVLRKSDPGSAQFARAACSLLFCGEDAYELWAEESRALESGRKEFVALLKALGYDASKAWAAPAKPAPKKTAKKPAATKKKGGRK